VKGGLVDDHRLLETLAGEAGEFDRLRADDLFEIFARRATEDFGLPDPSGADEQAWRVATTACLLCTDAAHGSLHFNRRNPIKSFLQDSRETER
ncbi:MAG: hypothetical protein HYV60_21060, partial [Planctomycetia bacterium]|nr:hypothetical protein [Planctomycetia bacterium]